MVHELTRVVRQHIETLASESVNADELSGMTLGLAHVSSFLKHQKIFLLKTKVFL